MKIMIVTLIWEWFFNFESWYFILLFFILLLCIEWKFVFVGLQSPGDVPFIEGKNSKVDPNTIIARKVLDNMREWANEEMGKADHELKLPNYDILAAFTR